MQKKKIAFAERSMNELSEKDKGSVGHNDKLGDMVGNVRTANIPEQMQREASESTERILQEELM